MVVIDRHTSEESKEQPIFNKRRLILCMVSIMQI